MIDFFVIGVFALQVPQSGWSHSGGGPSSGVPVADLPVPMLLHEAMDARTFPRLLSNLEAFEGGMFKAGVRQVSAMFSLFWLL